MSRTAKKEAPAEEAAKKPKKKGKLVMMLALVVLLGGGGLGATLYASGVLVPGERRPRCPPAATGAAVARCSSSEVADAMERARRGQIDPRVFQATYHHAREQLHLQPARRPGLRADRDRRFDLL